MIFLQQPPRYLWAKFWDWVSDTKKNAKNTAGTQEFPPRTPEVDFFIIFSSLQLPSQRKHPFQHGIRVAGHSQVCKFAAQLPPAHLNHYRRCACKCAIHFVRVWAYWQIATCSSTFTQSPFYTQTLFYTETKPQFNFSFWRSTFISCQRIALALARKRREREKGRSRCENARWAGVRCEDVGWANVRCEDVRWADVGCEDVGWANVRCEDVKWADVRCEDVRWADVYSQRDRWHTNFRT